MRLSERIQGGNTTNFLNSLNESAKLEEARSHKEDNEKAAPRTVVNKNGKEVKTRKMVDVSNPAVGNKSYKNEKGNQYWGTTHSEYASKRNKTGRKNEFGYDVYTADYNDKRTPVDEFQHEKSQAELLNKDRDYALNKAIKSRGRNREEWVATANNLERQVKDHNEKATDIVNKEKERIANKKANESANLEERNLTRAERYNRNMEKIWNNYNAQLDRMASYLKQNGFSDEEVEELRKNTGLGASALPDKAREVADKNGPDEWHKVVYGVNESALNEYDEGTNFEDWTRLVVEIKYVAEENGYDLSEKEAEKIADDMSDLGFFYDYELPDPDDYNNEGWEDTRDEILNYIKEYKPVKESCNKKVKTESAKTVTLRPTSSKLNEADSLELKEEYTIDDLDKLVWSGARDRWIDYTDEQKEFLVDWFIESSGYIDGNIPTTTEFNDFIWFESDDILEENGMTGDTSEEDEEETEE